MCILYTAAKLLHPAIGGSATVRASKSHMYVKEGRAGLGWAGEGVGWGGGGR